MQMRGLRVTWSPDSPGSDAMKTRTEPGNPEAKSVQKYPQVTTNDRLGETPPPGLARGSTTRAEQSYLADFKLVDEIRYVERFADDDLRRAWMIGD